MTYSSLEQRMAGAYPAMLPAFVPKKNAQVSLEGQREFYDLMRNLYQMLFDNPLLVVTTLHEDDAFPTRYKKGYGKPELEVNVLKIKRAIEDLLKKMFLLGQGGEVKLNRRQLRILSDLGVSDLNKLPDAWIWMSRRAGADQVAFAYCLFDEEHRYTPDIYASLFEEGPFRRLEDWMLSQGYRAFDIYNSSWADYRLTLTYANPVWGEGRPNGGNEYKIRHTGISAQYDAYTREPAALGLCIPGGLSFFLEHFGEMDQRVREFVIRTTQKCDGCRYCVQTDKTGKRPLAGIPVSHEEEEHSLCPYFPGYSYKWTRIDDDLVDDIIAFLTFMDGFAGDKAHSARCRKAGQ
jgi:hypothetical protein